MLVTGFVPDFQNIHLLFGKGAGQGHVFMGHVEESEESQGS